MKNMIISFRKFKNMITDATGLAPEFIKFNDVSVAGKRVGCDGFLRYENGITLYVNTTSSDGVILCCMVGKLSNKKCHFIKADLHHKRDFKMIHSLKQIAYGKELDLLCN